MDWLKLYKEFYKFEDNPFKEGQTIEGQAKIIKEKTKPPARYNEATLLKKMESLNLGTKSTRALIIDILFKRNYVKGKSIYITPLGEKVIEVFEKYLPQIIDVELTRKMEEYLEKIEKGHLEYREKAIEEAKQIIKEVTKEIKEKEKEIGKELYDVYLKARNSQDSRSRKRGT
ncbi:NEQ324 [Nanoarchaeum equitans Kin4-M]|uniref:NEQ324 n=1 Tax=Nanoarchaeum equitans (strain Kin4-M) TaxID=228908 RepID=Q74M99_NANEQ|nr:NEQ324 [Nanoarchaeum equitans Kin4-M]